MKKKLILIALAIFASLSLALVSCDDLVPTNSETTKIHDRGTKESPKEDIKLPDVIIPKESKEEDPTVIPAPTTIEDDDEEDDRPIVDVDADEEISFDKGSVIETDAGTGYSEKLEDGEILYATTNIGYEFVGWFLGNKLLSTNTFYKASDDEVGVTAKYTLKKEFEQIEFTSTPTTCTVTGVKKGYSYELTLPEGVTKIASNAFTNVKVYFLTLPESLKEIEDRAFYNSCLLSLTFKSVPTIGTDVTGNTKLYEVYLPSGNVDTDTLRSKVAHDNYIILYKAANEKSEFVVNGDFIFSYWENYWYIDAYIGDGKDVVFPDKSDAIPEYSVSNGLFSSSKIETVKFSDAVSYIESYAFNYCIYLKEVVIPDSIDYIGDYAFRNCLSLEKLIIGDGVEYIGENAFDYCQNLKEVVISENSKLETIDDYAFQNCNNLLNILIPSEVTSIGEQAFYGCKKLYSVTNMSQLSIVAGDTDYGYVAYYAKEVLTANNSKSLVGIKDGFAYQIDEDNNKVTLLSYVGDEKDVVIPTFDNMDIYLGDKVFQKENEYSYTIPNEILETVTLNEHVKAIGENAFNGCINLKSFVGENVERVGTCAFFGCSSLRSLSLPKITATSESMCYNCYLLRSVDISNATVINSASFENCHNLSEITYSNELTTIEYYAFENCYSLYQFTLPQTLTTIGYQAFYYCDNLVEIINLSSLSLTLESNSNGCVARQASNIITDPENDTSILTIENGFVTYVDSRTNKKTLLNYQDETVTKLVIPSDIKAIARFALCGLDQIEELEINQEFKHYDDGYGYETNSCLGYFFGAEYHHDNQKYVPESLKKVTLGAGVTEIPNYTFYECKNIVDLSFTGNMDIIHENSVFADTNIENVYFNGTVNQWLCITFDSLASNPVSSGYTKVYFIDGDEYKEVTSLVIPKTVFITSIPDYQFAGFGFSEVTLPDNIDYIGNSAFSGCTNLTTINLESSITYIGEYAFMNCKLSQLVLPTNTTDPNATLAIGSSAFKNNAYIKSVVIPGSVQTIADHLFDNCISLLSVTINTGITSIGSYSFNNCRSLYTVNIPSTLTSIGEGAFAGCENIESIDLKSTTVAVIPEKAFYNCKNFTTIEFSPSLTSIDSTSFEGCDKLNYEVWGNGCYFGTATNSHRWLIKARAKTIVECEVHSECEKIYSSAFSQCTYLKKLIIPSTCTDFDGCLYGLTKVEYVECPYVGSYGIGSLLFGTSNSSLPQSLKKVIINGGELTSSAFKDAIYIKNVTLKSGITSIPNYAFQNCTALTNVTLPDTLESIGQSAFKASGLREITATSSWNNIGNNAFQNCEELVSVNLSAFNYTGTYSINEYAFADCKKLANVLLPNSITHIITRMFSGCTSLTSIVFPNSLKTIGGYAFYNSGLTSVNFNNVIGLDNYSFANSALESITLPYTITSFGTYTFQNCKKLTSATINYGTAKGLFDGCTKLSNVTIGPSSIVIRAEVFRNCKSLTTFNFSKAGSIENNAFEGTGLTSVSFTTGLTIGQNAFKNCKELLTVSITGTSTNSLGVGVFTGCSKLKSATLPTNVSFVPQEMFKDCTSLDTFDFTRQTTIRANAFENTGFTTLTLPSTLSILEKAFMNCKKLEELTINCALSTSNKNIFQGCIALTTVRFGENVTAIPDSTFTQCTSLSDIEFPSTLTTIGSSSFEETGFVQLVIPSTITSMGNMAFRRCYKLESVTVNGTISGTDIFDRCYNLREAVIGEGNTTIMVDTFNNDRALSKVTLPSSLTSIGSSAFYHCKSLTSIVIPENVTTISGSAFDECDSLLEIYNLSALTITAGDDTNHGKIGKNAIAVHDSISDDSILVVDNNGFVFTYINNIGYLVKYIGTSRNITLPSSFEFDNTVIDQYVIRDYAFDETIYFYNDYKGFIETVVIPSCVTAIGDYAFYSCKALNSIILPEGLMSIGTNAFNNCMSLTEITIPSTVTEIGVDAFDCCYRLVEVYNLSSVNDSVTNKLRTYAKAVHKSLNDASIIIVDKGYKFAYFGNQLHLLSYVGTERNITLPSSVTYNGTVYNEYDIYMYAFALSSFDSVEVPSSVVHLGYGVFYYATLGSIKLASTLNNKNQFRDNSDSDFAYTFYGCKLLDYGEAPSFIAYNSLEDGKNTIKGFVITAGTSIDNYSFKGCSNLEWVVIPNTVSYIRCEYGFQGCTSLSSIYYNGTFDEYSNVTIYVGYSESDFYAKAKKYFYSEEEPTTSGNYWHWVNGTPTAW